MRRFLYISPFFPPLARVGALRPLKFLRHLDGHGWAAVVLCDLWPGASVDLRLLDAIPDSAVVIRGYSNRAADAWARLADDRDSFPEPDEDVVQPEPRPSPGWFARREWLPLGDAQRHSDHALASAHRAIRAHDCEAIVVNADPVAALVVGERLARETRLPLIADLRDPWGPCELRRPLRPFHTRLIEGWNERRVVTRAARVILNTETARDDYARQFRDLEPGKFITIRNHGDADLIDSSDDPVPEFSNFTVLFLGSFSRFVRPAPLLKLLAELKARGGGGRRLQLVTTDALDLESAKLARELGIEDDVRYQPPVRQGRIGPLMAAADMLILIAPSRQRIQAKFYDYVCSTRPVLAIGEDHPELAELLAATGSGKMFRPDQLAEMAAYTEAFLEAGRHPVVERTPSTLASLGSAKAAARLAEVLDQVASGRKRQTENEAHKADT